MLFNRIGGDDREVVPAVVVITKSSGGKIMTSNILYSYSAEIRRANITRLITAIAVGVVLILLSALGSWIFLRPGSRRVLSFLQPGRIAGTVTAGAAGDLSLDVPFSHYEDIDEYFVDLGGFSEDRPVFLFTFPEIEGEALCLTQNAKQCEQLLSFRTGEQAAALMYVPRNAEMLGVLQESAVGNFTNLEIRKAAFNRELSALGPTGEMLVEHSGLGWSLYETLQEAQAAAVLNKALDWRGFSAVLLESTSDPAIRSVLESSPPAGTMSDRELRVMNKQLLRTLFSGALKDVPVVEGWYYTETN